MTNMSKMPYPMPKKFPSTLERLGYRSYNLIENRTSRDGAGGDSAALPHLATFRRCCQKGSNAWQRCHKKQQQNSRILSKSSRHSTSH
ncbi:unnamed protein product [Caenorhabditis angaria]|uniref:Uncharacterized protein n=1 Tax=Caenorhabditis angaria TaxID=860376 RepID=A0A9P1IST5_9PELO|nr:unnamed protein product [Caenorhabditis angaria]